MVAIPAPFQCYRNISGGGPSPQRRLVNSNDCVWAHGHDHETFRCLAVVGRFKCPIQKASIAPDMTSGSTEIPQSGAVSCASAMEEVHGLHIRLTARSSGALFTNDVTGNSCVIDEEEGRLSLVTREASRKKTGLVSRLTC